MKKLFLTCAALLAAAGAFADEKSDALLGALARKVAGFGNYRIEFSLSLDGRPVAGAYEVSGGSYHLSTPEIEIFCDGATKYEVNRVLKEVVIDAVDPADRTILGNPTRLFDFLGGAYTHRYVGPAIVGGVNCDRIELRETGVKDGWKIDAYLSSATGLPVRLAYKMEILNTDAVIDVVKIAPRIAIDRTSFDFSAGRYAGFETIDFR